MTAFLLTGSIAALRTLCRGITLVQTPKVAVIVAPMPSGPLGGAVQARRPDLAQPADAQP